MLSQTEALQKVLHMARLALQNEEISVDDILSYEQTFEDYECWEALISLLRKSINSSPKNPYNYIKLAKVYRLYIEDKEASIKLCRQMIEALSWSFDQFYNEALFKIVGRSNYADQAVFLEALQCSFVEREQVSSLEVVCDLYEKQIFDTEKQHSAYLKLSKLDKKNLKSLRYLRAYFSHAESWREVEKVLLQMLEVVSDRAKNRVGQELAGIYLHKLNNASQALKVLTTYCSHSYLETFGIFYDCYHWLSRWNDCIAVLEQYLKKIQDKKLQAVIHYRIAENFQRLSNESLAEQHYTQAYSLDSNLVEALEKLVSIKINKNDSRSLKDLLGSVSLNFPSFSLRIQRMLISIQSLIEE